MPMIDCPNPECCGGRLYYENGMIADCGTCRGRGSVYVERHPLRDEIEMIGRLTRERDEAFNRGLHEGVAIARAKFRRRLGSSPGIGPMEFDDWSEVDAELDRRMSIPRASAAPSDKLSVEER